MNDDPKFLTIGGIRFVLADDLPIPQQCDACALRGPCDDFPGLFTKYEVKANTLCGPRYYKVVTHG